MGTHLQPIQTADMGIKRQKPHQSGLSTKREMSGAANGNTDALSRRDALWCQAAPPSPSELRGKVCDSRPEATQGLVIDGRRNRLGTGLWITV
ncbi:hypothetical protein AAFF_G00351990 [Aldrovandia affinis]|uniref:Uncharacterized protein n=1 Tax=Aldrovandia affinis TaxID=143900 RepID=A0AAD7SIU2_9TELE|nr:hypothetical protein AAFF_G00351990 [Aldrovandia affinis]